MDHYQIFTDVCGDLGQDMLADLNVSVLPMAFTIGGVEYTCYPDERELTLSGFYEKLREGATSSTSQVAIADFIAAFSPVLEAGKDILYIGLSSGLSGTINAAQLAAQELMEKYPGRQVVVYDSLGASLGQGLMVWYADKMQKDGKSIAQVNQWLVDNRLQFAHWFTVDDLQFLRRGGRLSGAAALAGTMLSIKPVLHVDDAGHLIAREKVRKRKNSLLHLVDEMEKTAINPGEQMVFISHGDSPEDAWFIREEIVHRFGTKDFYIHPIGPVIGGHSGPGTIALFFLGEHR
ncbi:DegV family protein [Eubacteriales bacterium OttesenSCG-928-M02]|nr:DegV family protein [Eubacteriales bacterium OttesenSCG-928-M02]